MAPPDANNNASPMTVPAAKVQISALVRFPPHAKSPSPASTDSDQSSAVPVRRTRTGKPKVKTGCITCKIRRVKCDETKPECERCTSTGRKCDGYATPAPKKASQRSESNVEELVVSRSINWMQGDSAERRSIEFFRNRTAPNVSSYFDTGFWTNLVLQVSQAEPAVRHALVAVGALNERRDSCLQDVTYNSAAVITNPRETLSTTNEKQDQHNDPFALLHYNKAITHLARAMNSASSNSVDTALMVCILFVCVECLRGDYQPALKHFQGGMHIALAAASKEGTNSHGSQATAIRQELLPFFNRLELLGQVFGRRPDYEYGMSPQEAVPDSFDTIIEARDSMVHLMNLAMRLIHSVKFRRYSDDITIADLSQLSQVTSGLIDWKHHLEDFLARSIANRSSSPTLIEAATVLEIQHLVTLTWLHRCCATNETVTDADIPLYAHAVSLAESLPPPPNKTNHNGTFLFDMEIVSPIYLVAVKCRNPVIRRRAIAVLRRNVRREGLWDSMKAAAIAERIVELEEEGMQVLDGSVLPEEGKRITNADIDSGPGMNPRWHKVVFQSRPEGLQGEWKFWEEWLDLRS